MTRRVTLLMLSGGVDSVHALVRLLEDTDDEVLVHHIHLVNDEGRFGVEAERCRAIIDHVTERYRPVTYSTSAIDHRGFRFFGYDMIAVGFEAGIVCHSYYLARNRMPDRWTVGTCIEDRREYNRFQHVEAALAANCWPHRPPRFFLFPLATRWRQLQEIGPRLRELVWSCRRPRRVDGEAVPCGACHGCELLHESTRPRVHESQRRRPSTTTCP